MIIMGIAIAYQLLCRYCQQTFWLPREDWNVRRNALACPMCGKVDAYRVSDRLATDVCYEIQGSEGLKRSA